VAVGCWTSVHGENQPVDPKSSNCERQILQLVAEGKSTAGIASTPFLSPKTVDTYRSRLTQKLDLDNFAAMVNFAIACGLTPPQWVDDRSQECLTSAVEICLFFPPACTGSVRADG
jgi:DNA-binding CsgD family transcriptional regulator